MTYKTATTPKTPKTSESSSGGLTFSPLSPAQPKHTSFAIQEIIDDSFAKSRSKSFFDGNDQDPNPDPSRIEIPRTVPWTRITAIMCADIVGLGVLSMPTAFQQLGWIPAITLNLLFACWAYYTAFQQTRLLRVSTWIHSFSDAATLIVGPRWGKYVSFMVYLLMYVIVAGSMESSAESLGVIAPSVCRVAFFFVAMLIIWIFGQIRSLENISWTSVIGVITIIVPVIIASQDIYSNVHNHVPGFEPAPTALFGNNFLDGMTATMNVMFAYAGHMIFFEFLSEITDPQDFPKAAATTFGFSFFIYVIIGSFIYANVGNASWLGAPLTTNMVPGSAKTIITQILIIIHVTCNAIILGLFLVRSVQYICEPAIKNSPCFDGACSIGPIDDDIAQDKEQQLKTPDPTSMSQLESSLADLKLQYSLDSSFAEQGLSCPTKPEPARLHPSVAPYGEWSVPAMAWWGLWSLITYFAATLLALIIPQFNQIISFAGALIESQSSYGWTNILELIAAKNGTLEINKWTKWVNIVLIIGFLYMFLVGSATTLINIIKYYTDHPGQNPFSCGWPN